MAAIGRALRSMMGGEAEEGGAAAPDELDFAGSNEEQAAAPSKEADTKSPSPYQAICDLVEATCHEIIALEGSEPGVMAPFEAYEVLLGRLRTYDGQLEDVADDDEDEDAVLIKDVNAQCRYIMGQLIIETCSRLAYPGEEEEEEEAEEEEWPSLIRLSAEKWSLLRGQLSKLQDRLPETANDAAANSAFQSLDSQMWAFEALAKLRGQLEEKAAQLEAGKGGKKYQTHVKFVEECLDEYKSCDAMEGLPEETADMFLPEKMLSMKKCNSLPKVKAHVNMLLEGIEDLSLPLQSFQAELLQCVQKWEKSYLPVPTLCAVGYFGREEKKIPKRPPSGYALYMKDIMPELKKAHPDLKQTEIMRKAADAHKKLSDKERQQYNDEAAAAMAEYKKKYGEDVLKRKKAPEGPKPPLSGYMQYMKDIMPGLKKENPDLPQTEVMKKAVESYNGLNADERKELKDVADVAMTAFKKKYGEDVLKKGKRGPRNAPKTSSPKKRKKAAKKEDSDSEDSWMADAPKSSTAEKAPKKKQKRIPYSDAEKDALRRGVVKHGFGQWAIILSSNKVFKANGRTNVNLKDLHRVMKNRGEI